MHIFEQGAAIFSPGSFVRLRAYYTSWAKAYKLLFFCTVFFSLFFLFLITKLLFQGYFLFELIGNARLQGSSIEKIKQDYRVLEKNYKKQQKIADLLVDNTILSPAKLIEIADKKVLLSSYLINKHKTASTCDFSGNATFEAFDIFLSEIFSYCCFLVNRLRLEKKAGEEELAFSMTIISYDVS